MKKEKKQSNNIEFYSYLVNLKSQLEMKHLYNIVNCALEKCNLIWNEIYENNFCILQMCVFCNKSNNSIYDVFLCLLYVSNVSNVSCIHLCSRIVKQCSNKKTNPKNPTKHTPYSLSVATLKIRALAGLIVFSRSYAKFIDNFLYHLGLHTNRNRACICL